MNESSPPPDGDPYEPPRSALSVTDENLERRALRWYHLLAFFSPAFAGVSFAAMGPGSMPALERVGTALMLGLSLCVVNGLWLPRFNSPENRVLKGFLWMFWGLIANAALVVGGGALVLLL